MKKKKQSLKKSSKKKTLKSSSPNRALDKSRPRSFRVNPDNRVLSKDAMPAGKKTCNGKLSSRDGYCQQTGVAPYHRCKTHGGVATEKAFNVFKKSVGINNAVKLQALINDTLSMDNELASAKVLLVSALEDWQRSRHVLNEYMENIPTIPELEFENEGNQMRAIEIFEDYIMLHGKIMKKAEKMEERCYARAEKLTKVLTDGIAKNSRIKEGTKFTMDIKQIRDIIKMQLEVMAANCSGCPDLKKVIKMMRERTKEFNLEPNLSKANKRAMGAKKYEEQLKMVEEVGDMVEEAEYEEVE